jgi:hypothetical protein
MDPQKENERKIDIKNYIGIFDGFILPVDCKKAIEFFENRSKFNDTFNRMQAERAPSNIKNDVATNLDHRNLTLWKDELKNLLVNFDLALKMYETSTNVKEYVGVNELQYTTLKIQKTLPKQGYHIWHVEHGPSYDNMKRVLAFTIYLNDIEEGGETEFLNQSIRVKPKTGRIVIWPAGFPYVHRGNPPLEGEKYILTSWLLLQDI